MANVTVAGASYVGVPAVELPVTGGGTAAFYETVSVTYNIASGASVSVDPSQVVSGQGFSLRMDALTGYSLSEVVITMGGVDVTSQVFSGEYPDKSNSYTRTEILSSQSFTPSSSNKRATLNGLSEGLADGSNYIVTYDGAEWLVTCETLWTSNYTIGQAQYFLNTGTFDSTEPFGIIWTSGTTCTIAVGDTSQHTVKIEKLTFE